MWIPRPHRRNDPDDFQRALSAYTEGRQAGAEARAAAQDPPPRTPLVEAIRPLSGHSLTLDVEGEDGFLLRGADQAAVGRIADSPRRPPVLEDHRNTWLVGIDRRRMRWRAAARPPHSAEPAATYSPKWSTGGMLWLASERCYVIRPWRRVWTVSTSEKHWTDERPVAEIRRHTNKPGLLSRPPDRLHVQLLEACDQPLLPLLVLLSCWVVLIEGTMDGAGGGGGAG